LDSTIFPTMSETEIELPASMETDEAVEVLKEAGEYDDPTVVEADEYEALEAKVSEVRGVLEEALSSKADLQESTIEGLGFEALCSEFEDEEGSLQVEALTQEPESREDGSDGTPEALGDDADEEKAEALMEDYQTFGNEALKGDIQDALGVSDWDTATEVLN